jgi:hypothetical protein
MHLNLLYCIPIPIDISVSPRPCRSPRSFCKKSNFVSAVGLSNKLFEVKSENCSKFEEISSITFSDIVAYKSKFCKLFINLGVQIEVQYRIYDVIFRSHFPTLNAFVSCKFRRSTIFNLYIPRFLKE